MLVLYIDRIDETPRTVFVKGIPRFFTVNDVERVLIDLNVGPVGTVSLHSTTDQRGIFAAVVCPGSVARAIESKRSWPLRNDITLKFFGDHMKMEFDDLLTRGV